tara:strand:- start:530 stop:838 length:309 start_codon:yes stop_codon:yes gene_type:complete
VTPSGIVIVVRLEQPRKAPLPIFVTGLSPIVAGISSSPAAVVLQSVIVTEPYFTEYDRSLGSALMSFPELMNKAIQSSKQLGDFITQRIAQICSSNKDLKEH